MESAIKIENLSFYYNYTHLLFQELSLTIEKGDLVGIVGPNGSGKTTLVKLILGLLIPQKGQIYVMDGKIGYVSQRATAFNTSFPTTVYELVSAPLKIDKGFLINRRSNVSKEVDRVLELVGLTPYKNSLLGNLSGGQQQRAFIARSLISNPSILFLDEPLVGVDQKSQEDIIKLLKSININHGSTVIMITHDLRWVEESVDLMICIDGGNIHCHRQNKDKLNEIQHIIYHNHRGE